MTEEEWLTCTSPKPMLNFLRDKASDRKLRLFAVGCCRRIDRLITDPRSREALAFAERHLETGVVRRKGRAGVDKAGRTAHKEAYSKMFTFSTAEGQAKALVVSNALDAAVQTLNTDPYSAAIYASSFACYALAWEAQAASGIASFPDLRDSRAFKHPEQAQQAFLLRDLFGNPFQPAVVDPALLAWNHGMVAKIAQSIYDQRAFDNLPVLADALEEAGCDNADLLAHCRGPGPHIRGCWAVDLLAGKE
jgi:hypothetical protein